MVDDEMPGFSRKFWLTWPRWRFNHTNETQTCSLLGNNSKLNIDDFSHIKMPFTTSKNLCSGSVGRTLALHVVGRGSIPGCDRPKLLNVNSPRRLVLCHGMCFTLQQPDWSVLECWGNVKICRFHCQLLHLHNIEKKSRVRGMSKEIRQTNK